MSSTCTAGGGWQRDTSQALGGTGFSSSACPGLHFHAQLASTDSLEVALQGRGAPAQPQMHYHGSRGRGTGGGGPRARAAGAAASPCAPPRRVAPRRAALLLLQGRAAYAAWALFSTTPSNCTGEGVGGRGQGGSAACSCLGQLGRAGGQPSPFQAMPAGTVDEGATPAAQTQPPLARSASTRTTPLPL